MVEHKFQYKHVLMQGNYMILLRANLGTIEPMVEVIMTLLAVEGGCRKGRAFLCTLATVLVS